MFPRGGSHGRPRGRIRGPTRGPTRGISATSMETARHHICIDHVTLIGLGQELHLHLPLQCQSEFASKKTELVCHALC